MSWSSHSEAQTLGHSVLKFGIYSRNSGHCVMKFGVHNLNLRTQCNLWCTIHHLLCLCLAAFFEQLQCNIFGVVSSGFCCFFITIEVSINLYAICLFIRATSLPFCQFIIFQIRQLQIWWHLLHISNCDKEGNEPERWLVLLALTCVA